MAVPPFPFLLVGLVQNFTRKHDQVQVSRAGSAEMHCLFQGMCGLLESPHPKVSNGGIPGDVGLGREDTWKLGVGASRDPQRL